MNIIQSYKSTSPISTYLLEQIKQEQHAPQPLAAGNLAPYFRLNTRDGVWNTAQPYLVYADTVSLTDLLPGKPLVVSFYSPFWHRYGHAHMEHLKKAHAKISALGGNLLVLTPLSIEQIGTIVQYYELPFSVASDSQNRIAEGFGVYSPYHPVWDCIAGISDEVALPATYVIAPDQQIVYDFVEADFSELVPVRDLLTAVYHSRRISLKKAA